LLLVAEDMQRIAPQFNMINLLLEGQRHAIHYSPYIRSVGLVEFEHEHAELIDWYLAAGFL